MKLQRIITAVDSHTEGQPTRVVVGGIPPIPGSTMLEKVRYLYENRDELRTFLVHEPRGHSDMIAALITEPVSEGADFGVMYLNQGGYDTMCGHGTIGVATVLVETGLVEAREPETEIVLDAPAGVVRVKVAVRDGLVKSVTLRNVPCFVHQLDYETEVPTLGRLKMDIAFGGDLFFAYLPAASVGLELKPEWRGEIISTGMKIWDTVSQQLQPQHPEKPQLKGLTGVMFTGDATNPKATQKNALVASPGLMDRSPCGTGTSGRMACLHARGELGLNEDFIHESIIGSLFYGRLVEETKVGPCDAVVPTITGRAWTMGIQQFVLDPEDPFPAGFIVGKKRKVYGPWG